MSTETSNEMRQRVYSLEGDQDIVSVETWNHVLYGDVLEIEFDTEPKDHTNRVNRTTLDIIEGCDALDGYTLHTFGVSPDGRAVGCYVPVEEVAE